MNCENVNRQLMKRFVSRILPSWKKNPKNVHWGQKMRAMKLLTQKYGDKS